MGDIPDGVSSVVRSSLDNLSYVTPENGLQYVLVPALSSATYWWPIPNDGYMYSLDCFCFMPWGAYATPGKSGPVRCWGGFACEQPVVTPVWMCEVVTETGCMVKPCQFAPVAFMYPYNFGIRVQNYSDRHLFFFGAAYWYKFAV